MDWNQYPRRDTAVCPNADVFLQRLTTLNAAISNSASPENAQKIRLLYRGVSNSSYRLVPSALRSEEEDPLAYKVLWDISDSNGSRTLAENRQKEIQQRRAELHVVRCFYQFSERAGLPLPPIANAFVRDELLTGHDGPLAMAIFGNADTSPGGRNTQWPPRDILPVLGLAQHYGLPTRLLDWSYSPLVASYFAASGALRRLGAGEDGNATCCVWATTANSYEKYGQFETMVPNGQIMIDVFPARIVQPPSAENPNLMCQRGVFTVVIRSDNPKSDTVTDRGELHDTLIEFERAAKNALLQQPPYFFSLHLPISEAPALLLRLSQLGYSANRIYDGYSGAAEGVREHAALFKSLQNYSEMGTGNSVTD